MTWAAGDVLLLRYRGVDGDPIGARALRVVADLGDYVAGWLAPGSVIFDPVLPDGRRPREATVEEWITHGFRPAPRTWQGDGILKLIPRAGAHSVWLFWSGEAFAGWYVNLETRHRPIPGGVETTDQFLDAWVEPDRRWRWKDEADFAVAVAKGTFSPGEARAIREEGERVTSAAASGALPFAAEWTTWRPDPDWAPAAVPADWASR